MSIKRKEEKAQMTNIRNEKRDVRDLDERSTGHVLKYNNQKRVRMDEQGAEDGHSNNKIIIPYQGFRFEAVFRSRTH